MFSHSHLLVGHVINQRTEGLGESASRAKFRFRKKPTNLFACDNEERENGVGAGVNATMLSETLYVIRLAESAARAQFRLWKNPGTCVHAIVRSVSMGMSVMT